MKYLLTIIFGIMLSCSVYASPKVDEPTDNPQPPIIEKPEVPKEEPLQYLPIMIQCGPADKMLGVILDHNEEPLITGLFSLILPNGQVLTQPGAVYMNPETGSVSIVVGFAESKKLCQILNGGNFIPAARPGSYLPS